MQDNFFSAVYKYAPVGVMILDEDANVVNINPFLLSMLSLTADHCKGRHFSSALQCASVFGTAHSCGEAPACEHCRLRQCIQNVLQQGRPVRCAVLSHSFVIDGAPAARTFRFSVSAVDARQGRHAVVSICDITREKQYELLLTREP